MENHVGNLLKIHMLYWPSQVILTAVELDLFATLGEQSLTAEQISNKVGIMLHCSYDFLDALVALRFLQREGDGKDAKYKNFAGIPKMLDKHTGFMIEGYKYWSRLKDALTIGKCLAGIKEEQDQQVDEIYANTYYSDQIRLQEFHNAMDSLQEDNFNNLVKAFDFSIYNTMLDIGSGSCLLSKIVNKHYPKLRITNFDLPNAFPKISGQNENIFYISGDFFKTNLPQSDLITMCNVLHNWGSEKKMILLRKAYNSLTAGGVLIIVENIIDDLRRVNAHSLMMSLNMLIEFGEGSNSTCYDFNILTQNIGFKDFKFIQLTGQSGAFIAYKNLALNI